jgi:predicted membrane chloride channel (bestrophin family)
MSMTDAGIVREHVVEKKIPKNYQEIMNKDKQRTHLLSKGSESMLRILMHYTATLLPELAKRKLTYTPLLVFIITYFVVQVKAIQDYFYIRATEAEIAMDGMSVLVAILLVSLTSKTFDRFYEQYFDMVKCRTAAISFMGMARAYIDDDDLVKLLLRYSNLANVTNFVGLTPTYTKVNFFDPIITQHELLMDPEADTIEKLVGVNTEAAVSEIFVWLYAALKVSEERGIISTFEKKDLQDTLLEQQDALIKLWNWVHQPLPFPYVNLVITMDMVYLLLYSFLKGLVAYDREIFTLPIIAVFILTISTLGLIRLSLMMNDPFSHEDWALRVGALCTSTILDANAMLSSRHREVVDDLHDILDDNEIAEAQELIVRKKLEEHLNQKENQKDPTRSGHSNEEEMKSNPGSQGADAEENPNTWDSL